MKNILIVEDEAIMALDMRLELENNGFNVYLTDNGKEALEIAKKIKIDLAILDIKIKGNINGIDLYFKFKKLKIKSIFSTANLDILMHNNIDVEYIEKPFNVEQISKRLKNE